MANEMISNYTLEESNRKLPPNATVLGQAPPDEPVRISIYLRRRPDGPPLPGPDHWAKTAPLKRTYLTHEEFAQRHGALQADIDLVLAFAAAHALTVVESSISRRVVVLTGSVTQANAAFGIGLHYYQLGDKKYRGREGKLKIPERLAPAVECVLGLDNRPLRRSPHPRTFTPPQVVAGAVPFPRIPLTPVQMAKLYSFPAADASSQTIGIMEFDGGFAIDPTTNRPTDVDPFFTALQLPPPVIATVLVGNATNTLKGSAASPSDSDLEVTADIDVAAAVAPGSKIVVYFAPETTDAFVTAFDQAIHDTQNNPSVLTCSWNAPEEDWSPDNFKKLQDILQEANSFGITILVCSMDDGTNCGFNDGKAHVEYPATDANVISCGGTRIAAVNGANFAEVTWNDGQSGYVTGGGISGLVDLPAWQANANLPPNINDGVTRKRGIPDVAGNASGNSGYTIQLYGQPFTIAGTSFVAPLYAGLIALINASLGKRVGNINSWLYQIAETPGQAVFRDIKDGGNNGVLFGTGSSPKYIAGAGWDACTGWGSIVGSALLEQLQRLG